MACEAMFATQPSSPTSPAASSLLPPPPCPSAPGLPPPITDGARLDLVAKVCVREEPKRIAKLARLHQRRVHPRVALEVGRVILDSQCI
jgi:hypothetical protein